MGPRKENLERINAVLKMPLVSSEQKKSSTVVPETSPELPKVLNSSNNNSSLLKNQNTKQENVQEPGFFSGAQKFVLNTWKGFKESAGYILYIPEGITYVVLNTVAYPFTSDQTRGRWINGIRGFCNKHIPGGSLLGDDKKFANTSDEKLKEIINPLTSIAKAFVEPLTTPLHEVAQGITDRVTFVGYNIYKHYSKESTVSYAQFLQEVEDEKNWHLRMGRTAVYTAESIVIAYYCGAAGAATRLEAITRTAQFLKMPVVMTTFAVVGGILKREDFNKISNKEILAQVLIELPKGIFDSAAFMLPISKLSQWRINLGINNLNKQYLASANSAGLQNISKYQSDANRLVARTQFWSELFDIAEGMQGAYDQGLELKNRATILLLNPWNKTNQRLALASLSEFTSSALDLVDGKKNKGHQDALASVKENAQKTVDRTLKGQTYALTDVEEVRQYFRDYHYRKLSLERNESLLSSLGISNILSTKDQLRAEIEERSKSIYAFYDSERDVIFYPKLTSNASELERSIHQSYIEHEEFHRRVAKNGIQNVLTRLEHEAPEVQRIIEREILSAKIFNDPEAARSIEELLQTKAGRVTLEEYAATAYQANILRELGVTQKADLLIVAVSRNGALGFVAGVFAAEEAVSAGDASSLSVIQIINKKGWENLSADERLIARSYILNICDYAPFPYVPFWQSIRLNTNVARGIQQENEQILKYFIAGDPQMLLGNLVKLGMPKTLVLLLVNGYFEEKKINVRDNSFQARLQEVFFNKSIWAEFNIFCLSNEEVSKIINSAFRKQVSELIFIPRGIPISQNKIDSEVIEYQGSSLTLYEAAVNACLSPEKKILLSPQGTFDLLRLTQIALEVEAKDLPCRQEKGFKIDATDLKEFAERIENKGKIACLVLTNPTNPFGQIYSRSELEAIAKVCLEEGIVIINDELFAGTEYQENSFTSLASLEISLNGKDYRMFDYSITVMGTAKLLANDYQKNSFACSGNVSLITKISEDLPKGAPSGSLLPLLVMWPRKIPTLRELVEQVSSSYQMFKDNIQGVNAEIGEDVFSIPIESQSGPFVVLAVDKKYLERIGIDANEKFFLFLTSYGIPARNIEGMGISTLNDHYAVRLTFSETPDRGYVESCFLRLVEIGKGLKDKKMPDYDWSLVQIGWYIFQGLPFSSKYTYLFPETEFLNDLIRSYFATKEYDFLFEELQNKLSDDNHIIRCFAAAAIKQLLITKSIDRKLVEQLVAPGNAKIIRKMGTYILDKTTQLGKDLIFGDYSEFVDDVDSQPNNTASTVALTQKDIFNNLIAQLINDAGDIQKIDVENFIKNAIPESGLKSQDLLIQLALVCAQIDSVATAKNFATFGIVNQEDIKKIALFCVRSNGHEVAIEIANFGLLNETDRRELIFKGIKLTRELLKKSMSEENQIDTDEFPYDALRIALSRMTIDFSLLYSTLNRRSYIELVLSYYLINNKLSGEGRRAEGRRALNQYNISEIEVEEVYSDPEFVGYCFEHGNISFVIENAEILKVGIARRCQIEPEIILEFIKDNSIIFILDNLDLFKPALDVVLRDPRLVPDVAKRYQGNCRKILYLSELLSRGIDQVVSLEESQREALVKAQQQELMQHIPWSLAVVKIRGVQDLVNSKEHDPWRNELGPLVEKGRLDPLSSTDGEILYEFIRDFGMYNLPVLFRVYKELKVSPNLLELSGETTKILCLVLGIEPSQLHDRNNIIKSLINFKKDFTKLVIVDSEEKLQETLKYLSTDLGQELFVLLIGTSRWQKGNEPQALVKTLLETTRRDEKWLELPPGHQAFEIEVDELDRVSSESAAEAKKRILENEDLKSEFERMQKIAAKAFSYIGNESSHVIAQMISKACADLELKQGWLIKQKSKENIDPREVQNIETRISILRDLKNKFEKIKTDDASIEEVIEEVANLVKNISGKRNKKIAEVECQALLFQLSLFHINIMAEGHVHFMNLVNNLLQGELEEKQLIGIDEILRTYVKEHYLNPKQEESHIGHKPFSNSALKALNYAWHLINLKSNIFVAQAQKINKLTDTELAKSGRTRKVTFVPSRGITRVYLGMFGDTCITAEEQELAEGKYPDLYAYTMLENFGESNQKIVGSVILIEAQEAETEKKVLVVRANNPAENFIRSVDLRQFIEQQLENFIEIAKARGCNYVCVPLDSAGESSSNRTGVSQYYADQYGSAQKLELLLTDETSFNGYNNYLAGGPHPVVVVWQEKIE